MYKLILLSAIFLIFLTIVPLESFAHRSGCHRWHSCPSDTGSYECGDLGNDSQCPNNNDSKDDDDDEQKDDKEKEQKSSTVPKSTISEGMELSGPVTYVVDGDTLDVNDIRIRFALVNTPEEGEPGFHSAKTFVQNLCLGENGEVDIDDGQRQGSYGREIGVVYCDGVNLNQALMSNNLGVIDTEFCDVSEFSNEDWAKSDCS